MLDQVIAGRGGRATLSYGQRVGRIVKRVSRAVAIPALTLMLGGLLWHSLTRTGAGMSSSEWLASHPVLPPAALFSRQGLSADGLMSAGLLALALVPLITVLLIVVDTARTRRWTEMVIAVAVAGILIVGIFLGRR